ncbi:MAG: hypothetical protein AAGA85_13305 [Bacteroidota bacterium]
MKKFSYFLLPLLVLSACGDEEELGSVLSQSYYTGSVLSANYPYVAEGGGIVFHRYFLEEGEPEVADDEYSEDFLIQIPGEVGSSFVLTGEELRHANILYNQYCFCFPTDVLEITGGEVRGTKLGDEWFLEVNVGYEQGYKSPQDGEVVITNADSLIFSGSFRARARP